MTKPHAILVRLHVAILTPETAGTVIVWAVAYIVGRIFYPGWSYGCWPDRATRGSLQCLHYWLSPSAVAVLSSNWSISEPLMQWDFKSHERIKLKPSWKWECLSATNVLSDLKTSLLVFMRQAKYVKAVKGFTKSFRWFPFNKINLQSFQKIPTLACLGELSSAQNI